MPPTKPTKIPTTGIRKKPTIPAIPPIKMTQDGTPASLQMPARNQVLQDRTNSDDQERDRCEPPGMAPSATPHTKIAPAQQGARQHGHNGPHDSDGAGNCHKRIEPHGQPFTTRGEVKRFTYRVQTQI